MDSAHIMDVEDRYTAGVYRKRRVVIVRGSGAIVWDADGREYIDCVAGNGAAILGHAHPRIVEAVRGQAGRLMSCPGIFYNGARAALAEKLAEITPQGLEVSFFSNSGAEAVEAALKVAMKYSGRRKFVAMVNGFHGRTVGALSLTWKREYREGFIPLLRGVVHVPFGDVERAKEEIDRETAAVFVEPIQGEGGVNVPPPGYLRALRDLCDDSGALLVFDEVQTGFGRTGRMFACEHWGVEPDVMCLAKGAAAGLPIGITIGRREVMGALGPGSHGSTFGGNPLAMAAALETISVVEEENLPDRARGLGSMFRERVSSAKPRLLREVRGMGLMLGLRLKRPIAAEVAVRALEEGLLVLTAGRSVVRLLPPLVITPGQLGRAADILVEVLGLWS